MILKLFVSLFFFCFSLQALELDTESVEAQELFTLFSVDPDLPTSELLPILQRDWLQLHKERWQMDARFEEKRKEALPLLQRLQFIETVQAKKEHYDYALVLGSLGKTMKRRLDFLYEEWQRGVRFDQVFLLTGQRDLDPAREEVPPGCASETDLFVYLFERHPLKELAPMHVVDSPKQLLPSGKIRRPNTASTVEDFLKEEPKPGSCLGISTQPFVGYQEAVVKYLLPSSFEVEGVGPGTLTTGGDIKGVDVPFPIAIYLDTFAKWFYYQSLNRHD